MKTQHLLLCVSLLLAFASTGFAQTTKTRKETSAASPITKEMAAEWRRAKKWTLLYLDAMPEDAFSFKPVPEVRSFAEQMLHLVGGNYYTVAATATKPNPLKGQGDIEKRDDLKNKAALRKLVAESYDYALEAIAGLSDARLSEVVDMFGAKVTRATALMIALDHQTHHRAQTVLYLRLKGVTPPPEPMPEKQ